MIPVEDPCPPRGSSIYMWMYRMGIRRIDIREVADELRRMGHRMRAKDERNYWNGYQRGEVAEMDPFMVDIPRMSEPLRLSDYGVNPKFGRPELTDRWVPIGPDGHPMVKWGTTRMNLEDALSYGKLVNGSYVRAEHVSENLKGSQLIAFDIDGDHDKDHLDIDAIRFFAGYLDITAGYYKREIVLDHEDMLNYDLTTLSLPVSYHVIFRTDRIIPTMHFPKAHVDIVGNMRNSLRHCKDKLYNGLPPVMLTSEAWDSMCEYIERKERS